MISSWEKRYFEKTHFLKKMANLNPALAPLLQHFCFRVRYLWNRHDLSSQKMNNRFTKTCSISYRIALSSFNCGLILFEVCGRPRGHFYVRPWIYLILTRSIFETEINFFQIKISLLYLFLDGRVMWFGSPRCDINWHPFY